MIKPTHQMGERVSKQTSKQLKKHHPECPESMSLSKRHHIVVFRSERILWVAWARGSRTKQTNELLSLWNWPDGLNGREKSTIGPLEPVRWVGRARGPPESKHNEDWSSPGWSGAIPRKGTNGVSTNGVTAFLMFFDRGTFWVFPLT